MLESDQCYGERSIQGEWPGRGTGVQGGCHFKLGVLENSHPIGDLKGKFWSQAIIWDVEVVFQAGKTANTTTWRQECAWSFKKSLEAAVVGWSKQEGEPQEVGEGASQSMGFVIIVILSSRLLLDLTWEASCPYPHIPCFSNEEPWADKECDLNCIFSVSYVGQWTFSHF